MEHHLRGMRVSSVLSLFLLCCSVSMAMLVPERRGPPPLDPSTPTEGPPEDLYPMDPSTFMLINGGINDSHPALSDMPQGHKLLARGGANYPLPPSEYHDLPGQMPPFEFPDLHGPVPTPEYPDLAGPPFQFPDLPGPMHPMNLSEMNRMGALPVGPGGSAEPNMSFCDMLMSGPVSPPIAQVPWFCICSRCNSNMGPKGDSGDRGLPGRPGSAGMRGLTGFRGPPGLTGSPGPKGQKGEVGEKGDRGLVGFTGTKGDHGTKGDKGNPGLVGPLGEQGPPGESGTCPADCGSVQAPSGSPGVSGPAGPRGLPGVEGPKGATGARGPIGDIGPPGANGTAGVKGQQGEVGPCHCRNGTDGLTGEPGPMGPRGEQGAVGAQGVHGISGAKGDHGDPGVMGIPGPCSSAIQSSFSACLDSQYPQPNMPVPFLRVISNQQRHFDPTTGVYRAPINGTYVFSYHLSVLSRVLKVGLFLNFVPVVKTTEPNSMAVASQQVALHLSAGDQVWLQVKDSTTNGMFSDTENSSTFSGFLLYPDSCEMPMSRDFMFPPPPVDHNYDWGNMPGPTETPPGPTETPPGPTEAPPEPTETPLP